MLYFEYLCIKLIILCNPVYRAFSFTYSEDDEEAIEEEEDEDKEKRGNAFDEMDDDEDDPEPLSEPSPKNLELSEAFETSLPLQKRLAAIMTGQTPSRRHKLIVADPGDLSTGMHTVKDNVMRHPVS